MPVDWVAPCDRLRFFHRFDVQVDNDCLLVAAYDNALQRLLGGSVYLLVGRVGRDVK